MADIRMFFGAKESKGTTRKLDQEDFHGVRQVKKAKCTHANNSVEEIHGEPAHEDDARTALGG